MPHEAFTIIPSLDELAGDPTQAARLPETMLALLAARLAALQGALLAALVDAQITKSAAAEQSYNLHSKGLLTAGELAERLNLPESWVRTEERAGRIPGIRAGRYVRFKLADVEAALARRVAAAPPRAS